VTAVRFGVWSALLAAGAVTTLRLITTLGLLSFASATADPVSGQVPSPAPYPVNGLERDLSERYGERAGTVLVRVDLGAADTTPPPEREGRWSMTILGSDGAVEGELVDIVKRCEYLCGVAGGETCHMEGLLAPRGPMEAIGTPLAAWPESVPVAGYRPIAGDTVAGDEVPLALPAPDSGPASPVWPPAEPYTPRYRLLPHDSAGVAAVLVSYVDDDRYTARATDCELRRFDALALLACTGIAVLLEGDRPLLVSFPDYNMPAAEPVARFDLEGQLHYLARLGLKAQTVYGVLWRDAAGWHALFRPRDYPLLC